MIFWSGTRQELIWRKTMVTTAVRLEPPNISGRWSMSHYQGLQLNIEYLTWYLWLCIYFCNGVVRLCIVYLWLCIWYFLISKWKIRVLTWWHISIWLTKKGSFPIGSKVKFKTFLTTSAMAVPSSSTYQDDDQLLGPKLWRPNQTSGGIKEINQHGNILTIHPPPLA